MQIVLTDKQAQLAQWLELGIWLPVGRNGQVNIPQMMALLSPAKVIGFGGAAGGGKTDLAIGKALLQHTRTMIMRRNGTELGAIEDRIGEILGTRAGFSGGNPHRWILPGLLDGKQIDFGSAPDLGDETKYQGRPHDLLVFDEATNFLVKQIRFLSTWLRTTKAHQPCQMLLTFNPPQTSEGRWVIPYFAPWLDEKHPNPAKPGELRYFVTVGEVDIEVPNDDPCVIVKDQPVFDFEPMDFNPVDIIIPESRTFIPSRVTDNPFLTGEYMARLQALPEPLRSQMLKGDFSAGIEDSEWQVCPTAWVELAMSRWAPRDTKGHMDALGVDVARGGRDNTIIMRRHGMWFDEALAYPATATPDGPTVMGLVASRVRDNAAVHVDVVGVGSSPYDFLRIARFRVTGVNGGEKSLGLDKSGRLGFVNTKSEMWWRMREALDPANDTGIALPPDRQLLLDLTAPTWRAQGAKIMVESREDIIKRIGRSPDWGSAAVLALRESPPLEQFRNKGNEAVGHNPLAVVEHQFQDSGTGYDPMHY